MLRGRAHAAPRRGTSESLRTIRNVSIQREAPPLQIPPQSAKAWTKNASDTHTTIHHTTPPNTTTTRKHHYTSVMTCVWGRCLLSHTILHYNLRGMLSALPRLLLHHHLQPLIHRWHGEATDAQDRSHSKIQAIHDYIPWTAMTT